ncbi:MAG: hypothetical protein F4201_09140 [Nitrospira sp. SB0677_bin_15]|nr:hypothetical protein [Nitrospira sp. SB0667_bin_9]MYD31013.1 hypothetical protein [Nitrospira sp. SB0661_bin_20]MYG40958.1 hypothetical protein [Nitrospira sp. SB0677_bin_15]MYH02134.1 hypothetical protein [Nitrospira sp. SB0675_bin_23]MYJ22460.1 hypothetical protein [Nitrospira sp. SB0673_bin_12]
MRRLRDTLPVLRPWIPESLLSGKGWDHLLHRIGDLPAAASANACGFEMRLSEPEPVADFSVTVVDGQVSRHLAADGTGSLPCTPEAWLARHCAGTPGPDDWIDWMVLAYDIVAVGGARRLAPVVYLSPASLRHPLGTAESQIRLAGALGRAAGRNDFNQEHRALARTIEALPSGATIIFAAAVPDRRPRFIRLVVAGVTPPQLGPFLDRLEWKGSIPAVLRFLSGMNDVSTCFMPAIDVGERGALAPLGLEMYPNRSKDVDDRALLSTWLTTTASDWRDMVDHLVTMGLCLPEKAAGLIAWPKCHNVYGSQGVFRLYMGINHVKVTFREGRVEAKAYAGLRFFPLAEAAAESQAR